MSSPLFDPLFGAVAVDAVSDDRAWVATLCEVEAALARAAWHVGLLDAGSVERIGAACAEVAATDPATLGAAAVGGGNPVIPLVEMLRAAVAERADDQASRAVHLGATSQDILDTASMVITRRALAVILAELRGGADAAAELARIHRTTVMAGRTLLQQAEPTTFGALAAVWGSGLDRAEARIAGVRAGLPVQYGGAAGTLGGVHPHGLDLLAAFAAELDLAVPDGVWHAERTVIAELAGALGGAAVAIGKPATDIVLLSQTEIGEVCEQQPGGSSAMPHKRNPIAAITARAAVAQAPGLVATLLAGGSPELHRGAGPWHSEWPAQRALLRAVGGGSARLRCSLTDLQVDPESMRRNLGARAEHGFGHAADLVDRYLARRAR